MFKCKPPQLKNNYPQSISIDWIKNKKKNVKCDLPGVTIDKDFLDKFCADNGFIGWYATSAQKNTNIGNFEKKKNLDSVHLKTNEII